MKRFIFPQKLFILQFRTILHVIIIFTIFLIQSESTMSQQDDISERLKRIESEIEKSEKELERGTEKLEKLKNQEQKMITDLNLQDKNIENISKNLIKIEREDKVLKQNSKIAQKNYEDTLKSFSSRSDVYAERVRSIYKSQKVTPLELLFSSNSMSSVLRNFKMFTILAKNDIVILQEFREKSQELNVSWNKLRTAIDANFSLAKMKEDELASLESSKDKQQRILDEIKKDEELTEQAIEKYKESLKNSQAEYSKLIRSRENEKKSGETIIPPSLEGYDFAEHKGNLMWPVSGKVVSRFGTTVDSKSKTKTTNRGIEIETKNGEPVFSIGDGIVLATQYFRGYGNFVLISHPSSPNDYYSIYGHLSDILVNQHDIISAGDAVGHAGSTGMIDNSSSRLVLEILKGETPVDPLKWLTSSNQRASR